jgi:hypothetical protein
MELHASLYSSLHSPYEKMKTTLLGRTAKESSGLHELYNDIGEIQVILHSSP